VVVRITFAALRGINVGRWLIYEVNNGEVVRAVNTHSQHRTGTNIIWKIEPPVAVSTFKARFPEATEVIEIMADTSMSGSTAIPVANDAAFIVQVTTIPTAGTPVNLASIVVPDGRALVVASEVTNKKLVYVATSSANALLPALRATLSPGNSVRLFVTNADLVWVDTEENGQKVVAIVEQ
jgi:hypothetical protein